MDLNTFTYADIMALEPCYDPAERGYCTHEWAGTALDVLRMETVPVDDRLWLLLREEFIPAPVLHEFGCWCAEQALALIPEPDPRSVEAIRVKRAWLRGEATDDEWAAAWVAAGVAARDAARAAAWVAAWDAGVAAGDAAGVAAGVAQIAHLLTMLDD